MVGRDFCPGCHTLYPWVRAWLLRPVANQELTGYEKDVARHYVEFELRHASPSPEIFGLSLVDIRAPMPRGWFDRIFGGGIRIQDPKHPKHRLWTQYLAECSAYPIKVVQEVRDRAYHKRVKELEKIASWTQLTGQEFERELAALLARKGHDIEHVGGPGDQGADIILHHASGKVVIQCKAYAGIVGPQPVRDLCGSMVHHGAEEAWLVAIEGYSQSAFTFAYGKPIKLLLISDFLEKS
jgi:hypothetical protein